MAGNRRASRVRRRRACLLCGAAAMTTVALGLAVELRAQDAPLSLTLRAAVELAARQNLELKVASAQSAQAVSQVSLARAATLPQIGLRASDSYQTSSMAALGFSIPGFPDRLGPFQLFDARPVITQNVLAVALQREVRVAEQRAGEQHWQEQSRREGVALAVIDTYLKVAEVEARLESARARLKTADALLQEANQFLQAGTASRLDVARATLRAEIERTTVADLGAERDVSKMLLAQLLGLSPDRPLELVDQLSPPPVPQPPEARPAGISVLENATINARPEIKAAEAQLRVTSAERQRAEAERYPTVAVEADFGLFGRSINNNLNTYGIRAAVNVPLYLGGKIQNEIRSAALKGLEAEEAMRQTRLQVETDVRVAQVELDAAVRAHAAAAAALAAARTTVELSQARFEGGLSTNIDVVLAQEGLASAEALEIGRRYGYHAARARLARARGDVMSVFNN
jgi:outer membrane protein